VDRRGLVLQPEDTPVTPPAATLPISPAAPAVWLASASPRRRQLLEQLGLAPRVRVADVAERREPDEAPTAYALRLAQSKGRAVRDSLGQTAGPSWIVAADTIVVLGPEVLEKPVDVPDAIQILRRLSGKTHTVTTAFWLGHRDGGLERLEAIHSQVQFLPLDRDEIERYVATGEPMDKAGAYGIQGLGGALVARIEGSYFNIVGLPIAELVATMRAVGALVDFPWGPTPAGGQG